MSELPGFNAPPVWEYPKHKGRLIAGAREHKGTWFFDLRYWVGEHGDKATQKGVTMPIEAVASLADALAAYAATLPPSDSENGS